MHIYLEFPLNHISIIRAFLEHTGPMFWRGRLSLRLRVGAHPTQFRRYLESLKGSKASASSSITFVTPGLGSSKLFTSNENATRPCAVSA